MSRYLILVTPAANRVFAGQAAELTAAELEACAGELPISDVGTSTVAGIDYVGFDLPGPAPADQRTGVDQAGDADLGRVIGGLSSAYALFELDDDRLRPVRLIDDDRFADDLVTIPKYQGKTNEQFTRLLTNVTAAAADRPAGRLSLLDPLCGRGTTLSVGLMLGYDVAGVEADTKSVEAYTAFLKTYLRRKRIKHKAELQPVRREGRSLGKRLVADIAAEGCGPSQQLTVFTGDTRQSAALFGKRTFDLVVTDAPYGVAHESGGRGAKGASAGLLGEAIGVWAGQLRAGGALGISWNTYRLTREELAEIMINSGLQPIMDGPYARFAHRVDSSINRDIMVARRPRS
ncbi:TRM11 family SAM-dependent methyltransferase [Microlunatus soli]|uniref:Methyltransferase domain-containing protein n=1 Tax=Microlunatus soli TaxID=630515 RepID=A0A1H1SLQ0_9ACTN|nr:hypothetical protein [Microlunatus soli]SDS48950.1 Methyltransferase domain-containing protein [Microlunatus soli]